jgi:hypothetical protein
MDITKLQQYLQRPGIGETLVRSDGFMSAMGAIYGPLSRTQVLDYMIQSMNAMESGAVHATQSLRTEWKRQVHELAQELHQRPEF